MSRPVSLVLCVVAMLLLSSVAQATMIWIPVVHITDGPWTNTPSSFTFDIPSYNPSAHGGAALAALRVDFSSDLYAVMYEALNTSSTSPASGTVTMSGGFEAFDPSNPGTVITALQHTWSEPLTLAPSEDRYGGTGTFGPEGHASASGTLTTDLAQFVSLTDTPTYMGLRTTDYSAWTGDAGVYLQPQLGGYADIDMYYGYDDGTPSGTPEPGTLVLLGTGLPMLGLLRRRRQMAL